MPEVVSTDYMFFSYFAVYARWIVGGMLLVAGAAKARDMSEFVSTIELFHLIPRQLSKVAARFIVGLELIIGSSLIVGIGVDWAAIAAAVLFSIFGVAIVVNLVRHNIIGCNCFGPYFKERISTRTLIRNIVFIALCLLILKLYDGYFALEPWFSGRAMEQNSSLALFSLLTGVMIISGIGVLSVRALLGNFNLVKNDNVR